MDVALVRLVLLPGLWISVDAVIKTCDMQVALRGKSIISKSIWEQSSVWDQLACAVACMTDANCLTFTYFRSQKKCLGYSECLSGYMYNMTDIDVSDSIVVRTCRGNIGKRCSRTEECIFKGSDCFEGICLCRLGLYFSPYHKRCFRECTEYADEMDHHKDVGIAKHNDVDKHGVPTLTDCCRMCVKAKDFTCRTAEWSTKTHQCLLSRIGYLDVADEYKEQVMGWVFSQRRCK